MQENKLKVTISCGRKFHALRLAEELDKRGFLERLITTYYSKKFNFLPIIREDSENINPKRVVTNIAPIIIEKIMSKFVYFHKNFDANFLSFELFDKWAEKKLTLSDVLVGWSGYSLHTIRQAKQMGIISIVERGSAHILYQKEILEEEFAKYGITHKPINEQIINKELFEYEEANYICVPSSFAKKTFIEKGINSQKLICVPYGVNLNEFKTIPKEDDVFRIIFVGAVAFRKGVQYLLKAFSTMGLKDAELVLIGLISPEMKGLLGKYEGYYKYYGVLPHDELYSYLSQGSVFILPSVEDGFGMVIL